MRKSYKGSAGRIVLAAIAVTLIIAGTVFSDYIAKGTRLIAFLFNQSSGVVQTADPGSADLMGDIEDYRAALGTLEDEEAVGRWLALALRSIGESTDGRPAGYGAMDDLTAQPVSFRSVVASLPPPRTWEALADQAETLSPSGKNTDAALAIRLFAATLIGDESAQSDAMAALSEHASSPATKEPVAEALAEVRRVRAMARDDVDAWLAQVAGEVANAGEYDWSVEIPDVVTLLGEEKAARWLKGAILSANTSLDVPVGNATRTLAQGIALDHVEDLRAPQWKLVQGLDGDGLFAALEGRFGVPGDREMHKRSYRQAQAHNLLSLIVKGRTEEAAQFAACLASEESLTLSDDSLSELERAGFSAQTQAFLEDMLEAEPGLPLWDWYLKLSAYTGRGEAALDFIRGLSEAAGSSGVDRSTFKAPYAKALLAFGRVEEGAALLMELLNDVTGSALGEHGRELAAIGGLEGRNDWVEAGLAASADALEQSRSGRARYSRWSDTGKHLHMLRELGHDGEAEAFLSKKLAELQTDLEKDAESSSIYAYSSTRQAAIELVGVYAAARRWQDVLEWTQSFPYWGAEDLTGIFAEEDSTETPVGLHMARALVELDRGDEAVPIMEALLHRKPGHDAAYALLVVQRGQAASVLLDELYARDRYEERPLIWKARLALDANELSKAKKLLHEAIEIDPSDGEQGRGDRMRAYALLAETLEREGAGEKAQLYRRAVAAIRRSEQADRFAKAGLYANAISMYQSAAMQFEGAYCIQSRLAIRLTRQGRFAEAAEHYRIAYRLMPDSFGRVESHCFLCENAFSDPRAQSIAGEVFDTFSERSPNKPQVHYMIGYLRKEQARPAEAIESFRRAVEIDPLYLSAWKQLSAVGAQVYFPAWEHNLVALKLMELDPLQRHSKPDLSLVSDLRGLWLRLQHAESMQVSTPSSLLPLVASRDFMEKSRQSLPEHQRDLIELSTRMNSLGHRAPPPPGLGLLESKLVTAITNLAMATGGT